MDNNPHEYPLADNNAAIAGLTHAEMVDRTVNAIGNNIYRMIGVSALNTFPEGEYAYINRLQERITKLRGGLGDPEKTIVNTHFYTRFLEPLGFVDKVFERTPSVPKYGLSGRFTPVGRQIGMAVAGAFLTLELVHGSGTLRNCLGTYTSMRDKNPRTHLYDRLLTKPASILELKKSAPDARPTVGKALEDLRQIGIVVNVDATNVHEIATMHTFAFTEPLARNRGRPPAAEIAATEETIKRLYHLGLTHAAGDLILRQTCEEHPQLDAGRVWKSLLTYVRQTTRVRYITEIDPPSRGPYMRIADEHRDKIVSLMDAIHKLRDTDKDGTDFQQKSRQQAVDIMNSPVLLHRLIDSEIIV